MGSVIVVIGVVVICVGMVCGLVALFLLTRETFHNLDIVADVMFNGSTWPPGELANLRRVRAEVQAEIAQAKAERAEKMNPPACGGS